MNVINKGAYIPPSNTLGYEINNFVEKFRSHLTRLMPVDLETFGQEVTDSVEKLVPPKARPLYQSPDMVIELALLEVISIADIIRRYRYIERYKFFVEFSDVEMQMSFSEHVYAVRNAEIYRILERGEATVRFVAMIASEFGVGNAKAPSKFKKKYNKRFERRLRERHRITHAHERRSLVSRILQLSEPKSETEREVIKNVLEEAITPLLAALETILKRQNSEEGAPFQDPATMQQWYLRRVDAESDDMWRIFSESVSVACGLTTTVSPTTPDPQ